MSISPTPLSLTVNGRQHCLDVPGDTPLLFVLRNDLELNGPKYGCGLGQCGACTVLVDGKCTRACVVPVRGVAGRHVTTLEGLGTRTALHFVQQAFIDEQAAQCGYCLNGMIMSTVALLQTNPCPTDDQIRDALSHNLCRCGTHIEILRAVHRAAQHLAAIEESK
jgi:nicotinate dehydrogenase subunit A